MNPRRHAASCFTDVGQASPRQEEQERQQYCVRMVAKSGEWTQQAGAIGARRAKIWLDMTTRADTQWINPHPAAIDKLTFNWAKADSKPFSFDLGGILRGGDLEGQLFVAESKYYHVYSDLADHYRKFLAQCYCALATRPQMCDQLLFITWHPFSVTDWSQLTSAEYVMQAVLAHRERSLDCMDLEDAKTHIDPERCAQVAERLWLIVLSERQERELIMSPGDLALIRQHRTQQEFADA